MRAALPAVVVMSFAFRCLVAAPLPPNFSELECALHQLAYSFGASKIGRNVEALHDALNVASLCNSTANATAQRDGFGRTSMPLPTLAHAEHTAFPSATFFVSTEGNDDNPGTLAAPFATLQRAQTATRGVPLSVRSEHPAVVYLRGGTYHMGAHGGGELSLTVRDSYVAWIAYAAEEVILSGAAPLLDLQWQQYDGPVVVAPVTLPDPRFDAWVAGGQRGSAPPMRVNSLIANGIRQVRARYPNGNPQDGTGVCFSKAQRAGEGCAGYSTCSTGDSGRQFNVSGGSVISGVTPNRGDSPTLGCPQCGDNWGTYQTTIYPFPMGHPVYNSSLPGIGWGNLSLYSLWPSPFARPAQLNISAACDPHFASATERWSNVELAVVHMFQDRLWGGWQFAVDNATMSSATELSRDEELVLQFGYGGYQEARGGSIAKGQSFFIENLLQELGALRSMPPLRHVSNVAHNDLWPAA